MCQLLIYLCRLKYILVVMYTHGSHSDHLLILDSHVVLAIVMYSNFYNNEDLPIYMTVFHYKERGGFISEGSVSWHLTLMRDYIYVLVYSVLMAELWLLMFAFHLLYH